MLIASQRQVSQYKTGKASLSAQGKRRYDAWGAQQCGDPGVIMGPWVASGNQTWLAGKSAMAYWMIFSARNLH